MDKPAGHTAAAGDDAAGAGDSEIVLDAGFAEVGVADPCGAGG